MYLKDLNLIIEYDTPFCHPNPFLMTENEFNNWRFPFSNISAIDKYSYDKNKEYVAIKKGFDFYRVYINGKKNKESEIKKLKLKIISKYKEITNGL